MDKLYLIKPEELKMFDMLKGIIMDKYLDGRIHQAEFEAELEELLDQYGTVYYQGEDGIPDWENWHEGPIV